MAEQRGERTARRAIEQVGVAFRLHAMLPGTALDCVGLTAHAAELFGDFQYQLRGDFEARICRFLTSQGFVKAIGIGEAASGDIALALTAPRQQHLMVCVPGGYVHAHAGLGQIVMMPAPSPWPIACIWQDRR
jgi:murein DD-endopeptidase / murein LD-carboxypeptidase